MITLFLLININQGWIWNSVNSGGREHIVYNTFLKTILH